MEGGIHLLAAIIFLVTSSEVFTNPTNDAIAILTNGDSMTQLRIIRNSPISLLSRLDRRLTVGQFNIVASEFLSFHKFVDVALDVRRQEYYLLDTASRQFLLAVDGPNQRNSTRTTSVILNGISPKVKAVAYDWLRRELYWGDPSYQAILKLDLGQQLPCHPVDVQTRGHHAGCVARPSVEWRKDYSGTRGRTRGAGHVLVLVHTVIGVGLVNPCGLAIDPTRRVLYWADDGIASSLHGSTLAGHNRTTLLQSLVRPTGLTLDYSKNRLYWLERLSGLSVIRWCSPILGVCVPHNAIEEVKSQLNDLDFYKDFLVMSDISNNRIMVFEESSGRMYRQPVKDKPFGVITSSISRQPGPVKPQVDIDPREDAFENILETGVVIMASEKRGILLVDRTFLMGEPPRNFHVFVPERGITTMAIDVIRQRLYYFVKKKRIIYRVPLPATINLSHEPSTTAVVTSWLADVTGMAVDWATGNLYWVDSGYKRIMMSRGTGHFPHVVHHQNISSPRNLVIHSRLRYMFWSDSDAEDPRIERSDLDGTLRKVLLSRNSFYEKPYALSLDLRRDSLYYSDGPFLCRCTLDGNILGDCKRRGLAMKRAVKVIDIMHDYILWTDFIDGLSSADMDVDFPLDHSRDVKHFPHIYLGDVKYFHLSRQPAVIDPCGRSYLFSSGFPSSRGGFGLNKTPDREFVDNDRQTGYNSGCSHLCVPSAHKHHRCVCEVGYWLKQDGACVSGLLSDRFLIFGDLKTKKLFRQFTLLPDYYAIESQVYIYPFDLAVDEQTEQIYWLDNRKSMIFCSDFNGKNKAVVFASLDFNMTNIVMESQHRLLYILTSSGHVIVLSLTSGRYVYIIRDANLTVTSLAIDVLNRVGVQSQTLIITTDMEGLNSQTVYQSQGRPVSLVLHLEELYWIDEESKAIYGYPVRNSNMNEKPSVAVASERTSQLSYLEWKRKQESYRRRQLAMEASVKARARNNALDPTTRTLGNANYFRTRRSRRDLARMNSIRVGTKDDNHGGQNVNLRTVCRLATTSSPRDMVITPDGDIFLTDDNVRSLIRTHVNGSEPPTEAGFPYLNQIRGLAYFDKRNTPRSPHLKQSANCTGILLPRANGKASCVCDVKDQVPRCRDRRHVLQRVANREGLCAIQDVPNAEDGVQKPGTFVMPGETVKVMCCSGHLLSTSRLQSETRMCQGEKWNSTAICSKAFGYDVVGNDQRGYVIFNKSMTFIVPNGVTHVDIICIGGGGGGFDPCSTIFTGVRRRAGMGGVSKFGDYLRAHGGQGGANKEGGRGGRGRNLFGGKGGLSSDCQGGGSAGETNHPSFCRLGSTSCPFCGAGGALKECHRCPRRLGGCGGPFSNSLDVAAADNYGGGATGAYGGGGGGGGGFSRKHVRVLPLSKIPVIVGRPGIPSAKPAGNGVVVVAWGDKIERFLNYKERVSVCKPYSLTDISTERCP